MIRLLKRIRAHASGVQRPSGKEFVSPCIWLFPEPAGSNSDSLACWNTDREEMDKWSEILKSAEKEIKTILSNGVKAATQTLSKKCSCIVPVR